MAIHINQLSKFINEFKRNIESELYNELAEDLQLELYQALPTATGRVRADFKRLQINKNSYSQAIIRFLTKGEASILLENKEMLSQFDYPRFVTFTEEPGLEDWVRSAGLSNDTMERMLKAEKVYVGGAHTHLGTPASRWFTNGTNKIDSLFDSIMSLALDKAFNKTKNR